MLTRLAGMARMTWGRSALVVLLALAALLLSGAPAASALPSPAGGEVGGATGGGPNYTHHLSEKFRMSDALCTKLKASNPTKASDPELCFITHVAEWTDLQPLTAAQKLAAPRTAAGPDVAAACPSGSVRFRDQLGVIFRWEMDLSTTFAWYGNCGVPSITYLSCVVAFTVATDIINQHCYQYTYPATSPNRRAAVYTGTVVEHDGIDITSTESQRRECFNTGSSSCYWTHWTGAL